MNLYRRAEQITFTYAGEAFPSVRRLFAEDRCHSWASIASAVVLAGASAAVASQSQPNYPNIASSSKQVAQLQASLLPTLRGLSSAEQEGGSALRTGYTQSTDSEVLRAKLKKQLDKLNAQLAQEQAESRNRNGPPVNSRMNPIQQRIDDLTAQIGNIPEGGGTVYLNNKGKVVPSSEAMADFSGYGTADINSKLAGQYADIQEALGKKYGTDYAKEAAELAAQADPQGTAARKKELELIQGQMDHPTPINPLSTTLESQIDSQLKAGGGLDSMSRDLLDSAVARANADRGGNASSADIAGEMSTGAMGQARRQAAIQKAQGFLQSGSTPEDINYRREQQNLSDMGAFVNGQTPESQFASLSGAGSGAAPFYPGQTLPSTATPASQTAYGVTAYQNELRNQQSQSSPWLAGLTAAINGAGAIAAKQG